MTNGPASARPVRILALGDSYTIGQSVSERERWPAQLIDRLTAAGVDAEPPVIVARTGWTSDELETAIDAACPAGPFDLVTLLIGVNNQYRGRPAEEFRLQFCRLVARAIRFAGDRSSRVVVLSIPDWSATPFAAGRDRPRIARDIDAFNQIVQAETNAAGARFIDVTAISRRAAADASLVAADGLHPSGAMYALWSDEIWPAALAAIRDS